MCIYIRKNKEENDQEVDNRHIHTFGGIICRKENHDSGLSSLFYQGAVAGLNLNMLDE
jgi:hypothetical protein